MQKQKQKRECPKCGGPIKRTIGAQTRNKFWECLKGPGCYRSPVLSHEA